MNVSHNCFTYIARCRLCTDKSSRTDRVDSIIFLLYFVECNDLVTCILFHFHTSSLIPFCLHHPTIIIILVVVVVGIVVVISRTTGKRQQCTDAYHAGSLHTYICIIHYIYNLIALRCSRSRRTCALHSRPTDGRVETLNSSERRWHCALPLINIAYTIVYV